MSRRDAETTEDTVVSTIFLIFTAQLRPSYIARRSSFLPWAFVALHPVAY